LDACEPRLVWSPWREARWRVLKRTKKKRDMASRK
jgi:hypothetical protein